MQDTQNAMYGGSALRVLSDDRDRAELQGQTEGEAAEKVGGQVVRR